MAQYQSALVLAAAAPMQGHQIDALGGVGDGIQQRGAKVGRRVQRTNISNRLGEFGQLCKVLLMFATFKF